MFWGLSGHFPVSDRTCEWKCVSRIVQDARPRWASNSYQTWGTHVCRDINEVGCGTLFSLTILGVYEFKTFRKCKTWGLHILCKHSNPARRQAAHDFRTRETYTTNSNAFLRPKAPGVILECMYTNMCTLFASISDWGGNERRSFSLLNNDLPGLGTNDVDTFFLMFKQHECMRRTYNSGSRKIEGRGRGHHSSCRRVVAWFFCNYHCNKFCIHIVFRINLLGWFSPRAAFLSYLPNHYLKGTSCYS